MGDMESQMFYVYRLTSKHQKKIGIFGEGGHGVVVVVEVPGPLTRIHDALVGGVDADHSAHGRDVEDGKGEDEARRVPAR